jgi:ABC-type Zn uptake system ZnuABC Zn-binding protein ZnuA
MRDSESRVVPWALRGGTLLVLLALGWSVGALLRAPRLAGWPPRDRRIRVLTTILPLYDFAREIGGPVVEVRNLLPPGVDPHEFALSPRDIALVDRADVLIANGAGLDDFLTAALRKARLNPGRSIVTASEGLPRIDMTGSEHGHEHESGDPHLWLDPVYARTYARAVTNSIVDELRRRGDERGAEEVRQRAAAFDARLAQLDADYRRTLAPLRGRGFIAFHGAFAYLAARYGLNVAGVWQTTPGREPGPREVASLLQLARDKSVGALLSEPQFSPRALEMIARDSRIPVYQVDPLETARDFDSTHYIPVMRANLQTLTRALSR